MFLTAVNLPSSISLVSSLSREPSLIVFYKLSWINPFILIVSLTDWWGNWFIDGQTNELRQCNDQLTHLTDTLTPKNGAV